MQAKKYSGVWQFSAGSQKMYGDLILGENGEIELVVTEESHILEEVIPDFYRKLSDINKQEPIRFITGYAKEEKEKKDLAFTLINSVISGYSKSGMERITFQSEFLIDKCRVYDDTKLKFELLMFRLKYFNEWIGVNGFEIKSNYEEKKFNVLLDYKSPDPIFLFNSDNLKIYFFHRATAPLFSKRLTTFKLEEEVFLNFSYSEGKSLEELTRTVDYMQALFALLFGYDPFKISIDLRDFKDHNKSNYSTKLVYFDHLKSISTYVRDDPRFLISYDDIKDQNFHIVIEKWFVLYQDKNLAMTLFTDLYYQKNKHIVTSFIGYIMSLETYIQTSSAPLWKFVLLPVFEKNPDVTGLFVNNVEEFAKIVNAVRVYYVHGNKKKHFKEEYLEDSNLTDLTLKLEALIHCFFLSESGVSQEVLLKAFKKSIQHSRLRLE